MNDDRQNEATAILRDSIADAETFARVILRLPLHEWQGRILEDASPSGKRRRMAVRAPNGAGKDDRIIAPLALWWLRRYKRGQVVITTSDEKQLANQTWRSISMHKHLYGDCPVWRDHDHIIQTPTGGLLSAWVTDEAARAEGYHEYEPDGPLLMIINEAKSVPDEIFKSFGRCSYNLLLEISTGGLMSGQFYEHFTSKRNLYKTYAVSWDDCPHLSKEKKDQTIEEFGENDPYTRSTIFGEFMESDDSVQHILTLSDIEGNRQANIGRVGNIVTAGIDFGGGKDANVLIKRVGNWCEPAWIHGWPGDPNAAILRLTMLIHRLDLTPSQIYADADGIGIAMCSDLDAALGATINRIHGGSKSPHDRYKNYISWLWHTVLEKVRRHEIKVPDHPELIKQLTSRRIKWSNDGKLWLESKEDMRNRGLKSPDYADAFVMAFGVVVAISTPWGRNDDNWQEISQMHGWDYTSGGSDWDESYKDRRTWNRPNRPPGDDPDPGFGGVHSQW